MKLWLGVGVVLAAPSLAGAQTARRPPKNQFELSLQAQGSWDQNIFLTPADGGGQYLGDLTAGLGYLRRARRSSLTLGAQATAQGYAEQGTLNQVGYAAQGGLSLTPSRGTSFALNQTYVSAYTRDIARLGQAGLVLPLYVAQQAETTLSAERRLSSRWAAGLDGSYVRIHFPSGALIDGDELSILPSLRRTVGRHTAIVANYGIQQARATGVGTRVQGATLGIMRRPPRGFGYVLTGGGAYLERSRALLAIGTTELSLTGRKANVVGRYERKIRQAFGYGREVATEMVALRVSRTLARPLTFSAGGTLAVNSDPGDPTFWFRSDTYSAGLQWALTSELSAAGTCTYWRNDNARTPPVSSTRFSMSLGYRMHWQ